MNCTLTEEQHIQFFKKIVIDLLAKHKSENPVFNLREYIIEIHDLVLDATNDKDLAIAYAALIPDYIFKARGQSRNAIAKLIPSDVEINEIADSFDADIQNVSDYVFGEPVNQEVTNNIMQNEASTGIDIPKLTGRRLKDAIDANNTAIPPTMLASSGSDSTFLNGAWTGIPKTNMLRTMLVRNNIIIEMQLNQLSNAADLLYSNHRGFKLRLISESELPENSAPLDNDNGTPRDKNPNFKVLVITDNNGNYLSFGEEGNIDKNGQIIYVNFRKANDTTIKNHNIFISQTLARLEKLLKEEKRTIEEIATIVDAKRKQLEDKRDAEIIAIDDIENDFDTNYINSPEKKFLLNITGGSTGIIKEPTTTIKNGVEIYEEYPEVSTTKITDKELETLSYIDAGSSSIQLEGVNKPLIIVGMPLDHPKFSIGVDNEVSNMVSVLQAKLSGTLSNVDKIAYFKTFVHVGTNTNKKKAHVTLKEEDGKLHLITAFKGKTLYDIADITTDKRLLEALLNSGLFFNLQNLKQYTDIKIDNNGIAIKDTNASYIDLLKKYSRIKAIPNIEGNFIELNGYFTIDHIPEQVEEIIIPVKKSSKIIEELDPDNIPLEVNRLILLATTPEQHKKADKWWANSPLSKIKQNGELLIPLERLTNIVNSNAFATWSLAGIKLNSGSDSTHIYHESWHAFSQLFLTKKDKNDLYKEVAKMKGTFTVVGRGISPDGDIIPQLMTVEFGKATKRQLEEYIAEEFRKFAIAKGEIESIKGKMKSIFEKIWKFLKTFFAGVTIQDTINDIKLIKPLNDMFNALYVGDINNYAPNVENIMFSIANAGMIALGDIDSDINYADSKLITESIDALLSQEITLENQIKGSGGFTIRGLTINNNKIILYGRVKNRIYERYAQLLNLKKISLETILNSSNLTKEEILDYNKQLEFTDELLNKILEIKPNILDKVSNILPISSLDELQVLNHNIELLNWTYINMGTTAEIKEAVENFEPNKSTANGVVGYHLLNSTFNDLLKTSINEDVDEDNPDKILTSQTDRTGYGDKGPNSSDPFDDADVQVVYLIKSLLKQDQEKNNILNSLGFPMLVDYSMTKNELEKKIFGTPDMGLLYEKILNEASVKGSSNPLYLQLADKLGVPGVYQNPEQNMLWLKFTQICARVIQPLISLTIETKNVIDEEGKIIEQEIISKTGKTYSDASKVKLTWESEFKMAIPSSNNFIIKNNENSNYLDLPRIVDNFIKRSSVDKNTKYVKYELIRTDKVRVFEFLQAIGINITNTTKNIDDIFKIEGFTTKLNYLASSIAYLNNITEPERLQIKNPIDVLTTNRIGRQMMIQKDKSEFPINQQLFGQSGFINAIARIEIENSNKYSSTMKLTPEGELKSEIAQLATVSRRIYALQTATNRNDFSNQDGSFAYMSDLNDKNNPQAKHSIILNSLYKKDGDSKGTTIELVNLPGTSNIVKEGNNRTEEGLSHATMNISDKYISDYTMLLTTGTIPHVTTGGKSTHYATRLSKIYTYNGKKQDYLYIDSDEFITDSDDNYSGFDRAVTILLPKIQGELEKILKYEMDKGIYDNYKGFSENTTGNFAIFDDILEEKTKVALKRLVSEQLIKGIYPYNATDEQIKSYNDNKNQTLEYILETKGKEGDELLIEIKKELKYYFTQLYNETKTLLDDKYGYTTQQIRETISKNNNLDPTDIEDIAKIDEAALKSFVYNNWINNEEITFLHNGDITIYNHTKDEATKRYSLFQAAGNIFLTDTISKSIINKKGTPLTDATQLKYGITNIDNRYNGTFNTAVIVDNYQSRKLVNDNLRDLFKKDFQNKGYTGKKLNDALYGINGKENNVKKGGAMYAYFNQTTTDGQAYITFDAYRTLKNAESKWSPEQEALYQKIIKGEKPSLQETIEFFPVYKLQYAGNLKTEEGLLPITAAHKFALYPLIPNVIEGGPLEELHIEMMKQGVHYVTHDSGSKLGSVTSHLDKENNPENDIVFNEETRHFIEGTKFTKNTIYLEYLKNQTEVNSRFKGSSMMSTQLRTLLSMGLITNGVPFNFLPNETNRKAKWDKLLEKDKQKNKYYTLVTNYKKRVNRLVALKKEELLSKIKWVKNKDGRYTGDLSTLINYFKPELVKQGLSDHELKYIEYVKNKLVRDLSGSPIADTIEKKLMSIIDKKIRRQTVTGEPLVEVSVANTMKFKEYGVATDLKFYKADIDGKKVTTGCQIRISLQGSFENLFNVNDNDGIPIAQYDIIDGKNVLNAERSRLRLNELIQDETWLNTDNNRKKIRLTGVRIPVQGHNSMEFMEVAEFLPPQAGNLIILPQEIVAKSGTDFDVDKLTTYMPTIGKTGKWLFDEFDTREELDIELNKVKIKLDTLLKGKKSKGAVILNLKLKRDIIKNSNKELIADIKSFLKDANAENLLTGRLEDLMKSTDDTKSLEIISSFRKIPGKLSGNKMISTYNTLVENIKELKTLKTELKEGYDDQTNYLNENPDIKKINTRYSELKDQKRNFIKAVENSLINDIVSILELPENAIRLLTANDTNKTEYLAEEMEKYVSDYNFKKSKRDSKIDKLKGISATRLMEYPYLLKKHEAAFVSKEGLGIAAKGNKGNSIYNSAGAYIPSTVPFKISFNSDETTPVTTKIYLKTNKIEVVENDKITQVISLSNLKDVNNNYEIAEIISQLMNGYVDAEKNAWIANIQGNKEVTPVILFLLEVGVPIKDVVYYVSNPLIRAYIQEFKTNKGILTKLRNPKNNTEQAKSNAKKYVWKNILGYKSNLPSIINAADSLNESYGDKIWDTNTLETIAKSDIDSIKSNKDAESGFLHYLYIEELVNNMNTPRNLTEFDTAKSQTFYDVASRKLAIAEAYENTRWPKEILEYIENFSPLAEFQLTELIEDLLYPLFKVRTDKVLTEYIIDTLKDYGKKGLIKSKTGMTKEVFPGRFINAVTTFIFVNNLKTFSIGKSNSYSGMPVLYVNTGKSIEVKKVNGVDTLNINENLLRREYKNKEFIKDAEVPNSYNTNGYSPVDSIFFYKEDSISGPREYYNFVVAREYLRNINPIDNFKKTQKFLSSYTKLTTGAKSVFNQKKDETIEHYEKRVSERIYEDYLRDRALEHSYNFTAMFFNNPEQQDITSYATKLFSLIKKYNKNDVLKNKYSIIQQLEPSYYSEESDKVKNAYGNNLVNISLKDAGSLNPDSVEQYADDLTKLADPNVNKWNTDTAEAKEDNERFSELFAKFTTYIFLQGGMNKNSFAFPSIFPTESKQSEIMNDAINKVSGKITKEMLDHIFEIFLINNNPNTKKFNQRQAGPSSVAKRKLNNKKQVSFTIYERITPTSTPGVHTINMKGLTSEIAQELLNEYQGKAYFITNSEVFADASIKLRITEPEVVKLTSENIVKVKEGIDKDINAMVNALKTGFNLIFNETGYGHNLVKITPDMTPKQIDLNKELYNYLSDKLLERLGYYNVAIPTTNVKIDLFPGNKIINNEDLGYFKKLKGKGGLPAEFFTSKTVFTEFYNNTTGKREHAPASSKWMLNSDGLYDLTDVVETGEVYIANVDLNTGIQMVTSAKLTTQSSTNVKPNGTINVYWGQAESATSTKILSNLAPRKFTYQGKKYGSVEHAYQSLKSGAFDQVTYDAYNNLKEIPGKQGPGYGTKIRGKAVTANFDNLQLMRDLVVESFKQNSNSEAAKKLLQYENFTHNTNEIIDKAFLEGLKLAQQSLLSTQSSTSVKPDVKIISEDYGVVQAETNPTETKKQQFLDLIKPQIQAQTYKENVGKGANQMFHFGKMWSRVTAKAKPIKNNSFAPTAARNKLIDAGVNAKGNSMGISEYTYAYHELDQNGNPLPGMSSLQPIIDEIQKVLGLDMSNYDSVIGNIYQPNEFIFPHKDVTESKSAEGYPVIVYTMGANAGLGIVDNNKGKMTFANQYDDRYLRGNEKLSGYTNEVLTKDGTIYTFGLNGNGRFQLTHSTPINDAKVGSQLPITLPNGKVITNYTITLTFRRAADLEPGMPISPAKLNVPTQPSASINEFDLADSLTPIQQNFADGSKFQDTNGQWQQRKMQDKFKDKSAMDLIISGDRTRTTRAKTDMQRMAKDYGLSKLSDLVGKVIRMTDKTGRQVYTRITKVAPFTQEYQDATWQKEGWVKSVTDRHVGDYPYAIEFEVVKTSTQAQPSANPSDYRGKSGGANQSDAEWDLEGEKYGVEFDHYLLPEDGPLADARLVAKGAVPVSAEEYRVEGQQKVTIAARQMGRIEPTHQVRNAKLIRNWAQVKNSDAVFAITSLLRPGDKMNYDKPALITQGKGGTGYAIQMAINEGKPVYVFNQKDGKWYKNLTDKWENSDIPVLTKNFAGIGTSRDLTEAGKQAIKDVYKNTFNTPTETNPFDKLGCQ